MKQRYCMVVHGRVQGVGYRYNCYRLARQLGITGYVMNRMDGSVLIEAEGEEEDLAVFAEWCHSGPPMARVDRVELSREEPSGYELFSVR